MHRPQLTGTQPRAGRPGTGVAAPQARPQRRPPPPAARHRGTAGTPSPAGVSEAQPVPAAPPPRRTPAARPLRRRRRRSRSRSRRSRRRWHRSRPAPATGTAAPPAPPPAPARSPPSSRNWPNRSSPSPAAPHGAAHHDPEGQPGGPGTADRARPHRRRRRADRTVRPRGHRPGGAARDPARTAQGTRRCRLRRQPRRLGPQRTGRRGPGPRAAAGQGRRPDADSDSAPAAPASGASGRDGPATRGRDTAGTPWRTKPRCAPPGS